MLRGEDLQLYRIARLVRWGILDDMTASFLSVAR